MQQEEQRIEQVVRCLQEKEKKLEAFHREHVAYEDKIKELEAKLRETPLLQENAPAGGPSLISISRDCKFT